VLLPFGTIVVLETKLSFDFGVVLYANDGDPDAERSNAISDVADQSVCQPHDLPSLGRAVRGELACVDGRSWRFNLPTDLAPVQSQGSSRSRIAGARYACNACSIKYCSSAVKGCLALGVLVVLICRFWVVECRS